MWNVLIEKVKEADLDGVIFMFFMASVGFVLSAIGIALIVATFTPSA